MNIGASNVSLHAGECVPLERKSLTCNLYFIFRNLINTKKKELLDNECRADDWMKID